MQVDHRGTRRRVTHSIHKLAQASSSTGGQRIARMAKIMEVNRG
jgi:hypothetical protein